MDYNYENYENDDLELNGKYYSVKGQRVQGVVEDSLDYEYWGSKGTHSFTEVEEEWFEFSELEKYDEKTDNYIPVTEEKEKKEVEDYVLQIMD